MQATAKVFTTGNSQAVRLPKAFRVNTTEMWISKNELSGEITLKPKDAEEKRLRDIELLLKMIADDPFPADFSFRDESAPVEYPRSPFEDDDTDQAQP